MHTLGHKLPFILINSCYGCFKVNMQIFDYWIYLIAKKKYGKNGNNNKEAISKIRNPCWCHTWITSPGKMVFVWIVRVCGDCNDKRNACPYISLFFSSSIVPFCCFFTISFYLKVYLIKFPRHTSFSKRAQFKFVCISIKLNGFCLSVVAFFSL